MGHDTSAGPRPVAATFQPAAPRRAGGIDPDPDVAQDRATSLAGNDVARRVERSRPGRPAPGLLAGHYRKQTVRAPARGCAAKASATAGHVAGRERSEERRVGIEG